MSAPFVPSLQREAGPVAGKLLQEGDPNLPLSAPISSSQPQQTLLAVLIPVPHPDFFLVPFFCPTFPFPPSNLAALWARGALIGTGRLLSCFLRGSERQRL